MYRSYISLNQKFEAKYFQTITRNSLNRQTKIFVAKRFQNWSPDSGDKLASTATLLLRETRVALALSQKTRRTCPAAHCPTHLQRCGVRKKHLMQTAEQKFCKFTVFGLVIVPTPKKFLSYHQDLPWFIPNILCFTFLHLMMTLHLISD